MHSQIRPTAYHETNGDNFYAEDFSRLDSDAENSQYIYKPEAGTSVGALDVGDRSQATPSGGHYYELPGRFDRTGLLSELGSALDEYEAGLSSFSTAYFTGRDENQRDAPSEYSPRELAGQAAGHQAHNGQGQAYTSPLPLQPAESELWDPGQSIRRSSSQDDGQSFRGPSLQRQLAFGRLPDSPSSRDPPEEVGLVAPPPEAGPGSPGNQQGTSRLFVVGVKLRWDRLELSEDGSKLLKFCLDTLALPGDSVVAVTVDKGPQVVQPGVPSLKHTFGSLLRSWVAVGRARDSHRRACLAGSLVSDLRSATTTNDPAALVIRDGAGELGGLCRWHDQRADAFVDTGSPDYTRPGERCVRKLPRYCTVMVVHHDKPLFARPGVKGPPVAGASYIRHLPSLAAAPAPAPAAAPEPAASISPPPRSEPPALRAAPPGGDGSPPREQDAPPPPPPLPRAGSASSSAFYFTFEELRAATGDFDNGSYLGGGGFGDVYVGLLEGGDVVAVKRLRATGAAAGRRQREEGLRQFRTELQLLKKVHHVNLVELRGCCVEEPHFLLVFPYLPNGSLDDRLHGTLGGPAAGRAGGRVSGCWPGKRGRAGGHARGDSRVPGVKGPPVAGASYIRHLPSLAAAPAPAPAAAPEPAASISPPPRSEPPALRAAPPGGDGSPPREQDAPPPPPPLPRAGSASSSAFYFTFEELRAATGDFDNGSYLGGGGFGDVYVGLLEGGDVVAVKRLRATGAAAGRRQREEGLRQFRTELQLLKKVHHVNLVELRGCCVEEPHFLLVFPYLPNGSLDDRLHGTLGGPAAGRAGGRVSGCWPGKRGRAGGHARGDSRVPDAEKPALTWEERLEIARGAAEGLKYLHVHCSPPIIHRDVKAANILLDANLEAQARPALPCPLFTCALIPSPCALVASSCAPVADFGLAKLVPDGVDQPFETGNIDTLVDVYAYGVVLLELLTGRKPNDRLRSPPLLADWGWGGSGTLRGLRQLAYSQASGQWRLWGLLGSPNWSQRLRPRPLFWQAGWRQLG
eukprot:jgi/Mesen1/8523/ME000480S07876